MRWLAIDTSAGTTVGVVDLNHRVDGQQAAGQEATGPQRGDPAVLATLSTEDARGHVEALAPMVAQCLAQAGLQVADLDAIAVGVGPAPFTGLRVGIATANALARATDLPVHGVCSLDAIAWGRDTASIVGTDARRREVYWAAYSGASNDPAAPGWRTAEPAVGPAADVLAWSAQNPGYAVVGAAVSLYPELGNAQIPAAVTPSGLVAVADARVRAGLPTSLTPLYLRRPDIHVGLGRKRAS